MGSNLVITKEIVNYINNHSLEFTTVQKEIISYNNSLGDIKRMQISISQCHFSHLIVKISNTKKILELGTFTGLSGLTMSLSLPSDGKLVTLDKNTERNKIDLTPTGLEAGTKTYPVVYLKSMGSSNEPIAFGGQDQTTINVRAIVLAQSQFELDAVGSIFRDTQKTLVPLFDEDEMPFNSFGGYKDKVQYNFTGVAAGKGSQNSCFVEEVFVSNLERGVQSRIRDLNPDIFTNIIDFELTKFRYPRNC